MFELSWRLFGTRFRISLWFFVCSAFFGYLMGVKGWAFFAVWIGCELVCAIMKEIGHVIAGRWFGMPGTIVLGAWGGDTIGEYDRADRWQRIIVYAAGPLAGLLFYAAVYFSADPINARNAFMDLNTFALVNSGLTYLAFLSLFWNIVNLLPMLPRDGGRVMQNLLGYLFGSRDFIVATIISILVAGGIVGYSIYKYQHPDAVYIDQLVRPLYPASLRNNQLLSFDRSPVFIAILYGFSLVTNVWALFRKPSVQEPSRRVS